MKQDATLPSTAWKGSPLLFAWDEWTDCQPIKNLPKDYWIVGKAKLKNRLRKFPKFQFQFQFSKICFVIYGSKANLIKKKGWNHFTVTKDLRSSVSQMKLHAYDRYQWQGHRWSEYSHGSSMNPESACRWTAFPRTARLPPRLWHLNMASFQVW